MKRLWEHVFASDLPSRLADENSRDAAVTGLAYKNKTRTRTKMLGVGTASGSELTCFRILYNKRLTTVRLRYKLGPKSGGGHTMTKTLQHVRDARPPRRGRPEASSRDEMCYDFLCVFVHQSTLLNKESCTSSKKPCQ